MMDRTEYDAGIQARLGDARTVPFQAAQLGDWRPDVARCHENVDAWVAAHPGSRAVRGWATCCQGVLTAHSVVAGPDGALFDVTPLADEQLRPGMRFVEHLGDEHEFCDAKAANLFLHHAGHVGP